MSDPRATILIVDDEPQNLHLLGEALRDDYEIIIATSGIEAIKRAQSDTPPDLILLDIVMPEMDGMQVCQALKANTHTVDIPVIFITAKSDVVDEERGLLIGAVDYITKPFSAAIVKARVCTHLKLKAQTDMLTKLSLMDEMTGIPNRRQFDMCLKDEWQRLSRTGDDLTIIMMDVDYFKQYNDNYGHLSGDECLRQVATALSRVVYRAGDMVARYGGEEFVALLPNVNSVNGLLVAENFRQSIESLGLEHQQSSVGKVVTISLGVATCTPKEHTNPKALLEVSDRMLYASKNNGRNQATEDILSP